MHSFALVRVLVLAACVFLVAACVSPAAPAPVSSAAVARSPAVARVAAAPAAAPCSVPAPASLVPEQPSPAGTPIAQPSSGLVGRSESNQASTCSWALTRLPRSGPFDVWLGGGELYKSLCTMMGGTTCVQPLDEEALSALCRLWLQGDPESALRDGPKIDGTGVDGCADGWTPFLAQGLRWYGAILGDGRVVTFPYLEPVGAQRKEWGEPKVEVVSRGAYVVVVESWDSFTCPTDAESPCVEGVGSAAMRVCLADRRVSCRSHGRVMKVHWYDANADRAAVSPEVRHTSVELREDGGLVVGGSCVAAKPPGPGGNLLRESPEYP